MQAVKICSYCNEIYIDFIPFLLLCCDKIRITTAWNEVLSGQNINHPSIDKKHTFYISAQLVSRSLRSLNIILNISREVTFSVRQ